MRGQCFDIREDDGHDILSDTGFWSLCHMMSRHIFHSVEPLEALYAQVIPNMSEHIKTHLNVGLCRLLPGALIVLGPPCSLFVWMSSSVHCRSELRPMGDESRFVVRMANAISRNTVSCQVH